MIENRYLEQGYPMIAYLQREKLKGRQKIEFHHKWSSSVIECEHFQKPKLKFHLIQKL